jgi:hypothetical protein
VDAEEVDSEAWVQRGLTQSERGSFGGEEEDLEGFVYGPRKDMRRNRLCRTITSRLWNDEVDSSHYWPHWR